jgi:hypothetical protein
LGHTWGMDYRTTRDTSGSSRIPRSCHLSGEMFGASRSLRAGFFLTRKRSQELSAALTMAVMTCHISPQAAPCGRPQAAVLGRRTPDGGRARIVRFPAARPHRPADALPQAPRIWIGLALRAPRLGTLHPAADRPIPLANRNSARTGRCRGAARSSLRDSLCSN